MPGDLAGDFTHVHRAVGSGHSQGRATGDFVLMLAVLGQEHFRLDATGTQGAEQPTAKLGTLTLGLQRKRQVFNVAGVQVEFMLERRIDLQAQLGAITLYLVAQHRTRAGTPRAAIGFANVTVNKIQRRSVGIRAVIDRHSAGRIGHQPQISISAPRVGVGDDVLRGQRAVGRHPATTRPLIVLEFVRGKGAPACHADQVGGDEGGHGQWQQALAHGCISCNRPSTVWVSVIQQ